MPERLTPAESYCIAGRAYVTGAHAIVKSEMRARFDNDVRFIIPCMMLIGHAIEVYLKAWLTFRGLDEKSLRTQALRHNLRALYEAARLNGLPEPEMPPQQSFHDLVESYEVDHADFSFRYPTDGWTFAVPRLDLVFQILKVLDEVVGREVGMSKPGSLDWTISPAEDFRPLNNNPLQS